MPRAHSLRCFFATSALLASCAMGMLPTPALAAPPWATLIPFKKVDADPNKSYELEENRGPWMIMAASFAGSGPGASRWASVVPAMCFIVK